MILTLIDAAEGVLNPLRAEADCMMPPSGSRALEALPWLAYL